MRSHWFAICFCFGCQDLSSVEPNRCGNRVVEGDEHCDGYAPPDQACGGPNSPLACRWTCDRGSGLVCPDGWGCGSDGICRRPSGSFSFLGSWPHLGGTPTLTDTDGDQDLDLFSRSTQRLQIRRNDGHGGFDAALETSTRLTTFYTPSEVVDLNGDGASDFVGVSTFGIQTFLGGDLGFTPVTYPVEAPELANARIVALTSSVGRPTMQDLVVLERDRFSFATDGVEAMFPRSVEPSHLLVTAGDLNQDGRADLVIAERHSQEVWIYRQAQGSDRSWELSQTINNPRVVSSPVLMVDLNEDSVVDLIFDWNHIAIQSETGHFPDEPCKVDLSLEGLLNPDATADFDGDGTIDFVSRSGIGLNRTGPIHCGDDVDLQAVIAGRTWSNAWVADFDGDGDSDVVALSITDVEVLLNDGRGGFAPRLVEGVGSPDRIIPGDFDGDGRDDLILRSFDHLSIVYSEGNGFTDPITYALGPIVDIVLLHTGTTSESLDGIIDLLVLFEKGEEVKKPHTLILRGEGSRVPSSLFHPELPPNHWVDDVIIGNFCRSDGTGFDPPELAFLVSETSRLPPNLGFLPVLPSPAGAFGTYFELQRASRPGLDLAEAMDLDGDGLDELVAIMPSEVIMMKLQGSGEQCVSEARLGRVPLPVTVGSRTRDRRSIDLDRDGVSEVVVSIDHDVYVFWRMLPGAEPFPVTRIPMPDPDFGIYFDAGQVDTDDPLELFVYQTETLFTPGRVAIYDLEPNAPEATLLATEILVSDSTVVRIELKDVTGDRLDDLIVTYAKAFEVYAGTDGAPIPWKTTRSD